MQLPYENWTKLYNNEDFFASAPYYASTDGLLFIVRDSSKTEREMTMEERELYKSDDFELAMFSAGGGKGGAGGKGGKGVYVPKEKGI